MWGLHKLGANTYGYDLCDWSRTFEHVNAQKELAELVDNANLRSLSLCASGNFYRMQGKPVLAQVDFDAAITQSKAASPQTRGTVYVYAARAAVEVDLSGITRAQTLLDQAERYAGTPDDSQTVRFEECDYLKHKAKILVAAGRYGKALEFLDDAEEKWVAHTDGAEYEASDKRTLEYLSILRSECFIKQKKPEYEQAILLLCEVLEQNRHIKEQYHIDRVKRLHKMLLASSYGNAPDVADLGIALRELQGKK